MYSILQNIYQPLNPGGGGTGVNQLGTLYRLELSLLKQKICALYLLCNYLLLSSLIATLSQLSDMLHPSSDVAKPRPNNAPFCGDPQREGTAQLVHIQV